MATKLFENNEIVTSPADVDRFAFGQDGVAGSKFWSWANFKSWLSGLYANLSASNLSAANILSWRDNLGFYDTYEKLLWHNSFNSGSLDLMNLDINDNDQIIIRNAGVVSELVLYVNSLGTNPNGATLNVTNDGNNLFPVPVSLDLGFNFIVLSSNLNVVKHSILKLENPTGTGANYAGIVQVFVTVKKS